MVLEPMRLMRQTRMLRDEDILAILSGTPRPFGKRTRLVVGGARLVLQPPLPRGHAMLLGLNMGLFKHMVAVYRCHDGHYIYHDSQDSPPHPAFLQYCVRNKISKLDVKIICNKLQDDQFGTCAYHSLTFVDFMTRCPDRNVYSVIMKFRRHMASRPDVRAVLTVESILREFKNTVNISVFGFPSAGSTLMWE